MKKLPFSLFAKVFLVSLALVFFITTGIAMYFTGHMMAISQSQKQKEIALTVENANRFIDSLYTSMINAFNYVLLPENTNSTTLIENFDRVRAYTQANKDMIHAIHLIRSNTSTLKDRVVSTEQSLAEIFCDRNFFSLYNQSVQKVGAITISKPYFSSLQSQRTISFMKPLKNSNGFYSDVLVVECNANYLSDSLLAFLSSTKESLLIFNADMLPIAFDEQSQLLEMDYSSYPPSFSDTFTSLMSHLSNGFSTVEYNGKTLHLYSNSKNMLRWKSVYLVDKNYYYKDAYALLYASLRGLFPYLPFMFVFCWFLSGYITKPIKRLAHQMDSIHNDFNLDSPPETRKDEIGILSRSFYKMLIRIQKLMESQLAVERQKQEIQLKLLQSQIQPHFLGNTLLCINTLAHQGNTSQLETCIKALIRLLYASTDKCGQIFALSKEFECLQSYIDIQSLRYQRSFKLDISVPDDYLDYPIPKLMLQPIVENSLLHGFDEYCIAPRVEVNGLCTDDNFHIFVSDNGIGIPHERIQQILEDQTPTSRGRFSSIGIANIRQRIRLYYGGDCDLYIHSTPECGTTVEFCLPLKGDLPHEEA